MGSNRVTIAGNITVDTIHRPGHAPATDLGGSVYCTVALAALAPEIEVVPVANVGEDVYSEVVSLFAPLPNINLSGLRRVPDRNVHAHLFLVSEYGVQFDEGRAQPVNFSHLRPFLDCEFLLVTFPTGFDLELRTLRRASAECEGRVYLDYHILTRGRDETSVRYLRYRPNWREWTQTADYVQMNRFEAEHLSQGPERHSHLCKLPCHVKSR